jgi:hypothetical protein
VGVADVGGERQQALFELGSFLVPAEQPADGESVAQVVLKPTSA